MLAAEDCVITSEYLNWGGGSHSQNIDSSYEMMITVSWSNYSHQEHMGLQSIGASGNVCHCNEWHTYPACSRFHSHLDDPFPLHGDWIYRLVVPNSSKPQTSLLLFTPECLLNWWTICQITMIWLFCGSSTQIHFRLEFLFHDIEPSLWLSC